MECENEEGGMKRKHSVKVPRLYKEASRIFDGVEKGVGLKGAIFAAKHPNKRALTALVSEALRHREELEECLQKAHLDGIQQGLCLPLAKILMTELLWGKGRLGGTSKPIQTILSCKEKFEAILKKRERKRRGKGLIEAESGREIRKPRYVRVNSLLSCTDEVIEYLREDGWEERIAVLDPLNMDEGTFQRDILLDVLVFPPRTYLHTHPLYTQGKIILQDKASCLPALALRPPPGSSVIDACAAPGMKTTHLAALMLNQGKIIAVEKDKDRCETLRELSASLGASIVSVRNMDFTDINPMDHPDVEYILLDPSCSGSGMVDRLGSNIDREDRVEKLSFYQKKLLVHAMSFPGVKRILYSTCSIYSQENEQVVAGALRDNPSFRLKRALPSWTHRTQNIIFPWADKCVSADYSVDRTDGFFVALFQKKKAKKDSSTDSTSESNLL